MHVQPQPIRLSIHGKLIATAIIIGVSIWLLRSIGHVLTPFVAAIITAYLFNPLVSLFERRLRVKRAISIIVIYVVVFSLIYGLAIWVWPRIVWQYEEMIQRLPRIIAEVASTFQGREVVEIAGSFTLDLTPIEDQLIGTLSDLGRTLSGNVPHLVFSALETAIYTLVYLIITFYLLLQSRELHQWAVNLIPAPYREEICDLGRQIDQVLGAYIRGQLLLIVIMSVLTYIPLAILQVPYALVIAIASGVLELVPLLGPWSAAAIAMTVSFFQPEIPFGLSKLSLTSIIALIYFLLRQIEDSFIIPNIVGHLVKLHPGVVIFAILAGGTIAGPLGLLIAIPTAAVARIILAYLYTKIVDAPDLSFQGFDPLPSGEGEQQEEEEEEEHGEKTSSSTTKPHTHASQPSSSSVVDAGYKRLDCHS